MNPLYKCSDYPFRPWQVSFVEPDGQVCIYFCDMFAITEDGLELYYGAEHVASVKPGGLLELKIV